MKWIFSRQFPEAAGLAVSISAMYLLCYFVDCAAIAPVQQLFFPGLGSSVSLLFLPHGVRVLAMSLLGRQAVPGLIAAEFTSSYLFGGLTDPLTVLLAAVTGGAMVWITFEGLRKLGIDAFYLHAANKPPPFQTLLLAAIATSVVNAFFLASILDGAQAQAHVTLVIAALFTGNVTGFLAVIITAKSLLTLLTGKPD